MIRFLGYFSVGGAFGAGFALTIGGWAGLCFTYGVCVVVGTFFGWSGR